MASEDVIDTFCCEMERSWQSELQLLLEAHCEGVGRAADPVLRPVPARIMPPLGSDEARTFLLGMEAGLFDIDHDGHVRGEFLAPCPPNGQRRLQLFQLKPARVEVSRRAICRLATAAALVIDRGWLEQQVEVAASLEESPPAPRCADILVTSLQGTLLAAVDIKRTMHDIAKLQRDLHQCCRRGRHAEDNCGFPQNHSIFEFCASHQPPYFWALSPDAEICFRMTYTDDGTIQLQEYSSLPPRSIVEMRGNA